MYAIGKYTIANPPIATNSIQMFGIGTNHSTAPIAIASAANANQLQAMIDAVEEDLYKAGHTCAQTEGNQRSSWVLMDYKDIIVHLFSKEDRLFYDLERIWQDGTFISPEEL